MSDAEARQPTDRLSQVLLSIEDLAGAGYVRAVAEASAFLRESSVEEILGRLVKRVDFFPTDLQLKCDAILPRVGEQVISARPSTASGAGTESFTAATDSASAPLSGLGFLRIGEDGKVHLVAKSEHYHASLGHSFPGYRLIDVAREAGIPNATHNNTRGHLTRIAEETLIAAANGVNQHDPEFSAILQSDDPRTLNRVINLETGSLAVEAALKMMLARFYRLDGSHPHPEYAGKRPVFLVLGDNNGDLTANYHGTTLVTQLFRGLWPGLSERVQAAGAMRVIPVAINDRESFAKAVDEYDRGEYKVAGFFHEIVMMNYGAILLTRDYLADVYDLCHEHDIPVAADEIQSCMWSPEFFLFREYGLCPDFVAVGKGFPGGEYPASRILCTSKMDNLNLFGALVTNGQEELASLAYLVTMSFVGRNRNFVRDLGEYYEARLRDLQAGFPTLVSGVNGLRHMSSLEFTSSVAVSDFVNVLRDRCIDVSAQAYKKNALPVALTKLPLVSSYALVDYLIGEMQAALESI